MKAVADLLNLFIASAYVAQVGIGCVPTLSSCFEIASFIAILPFFSWHKVSTKTSLHSHFALSLASFGNLPQKPRKHNARHGGRQKPMSTYLLF
jgi:hypothetical protein